jgi:putative phosphoribosyl transferase
MAVSIRPVRVTGAPYADRREAGRTLAKMLGHLAGENLVVLGLPRGGVPVAFEVAEALGAPLDVLVVRKLGVPVRPEFGMGAVGEEGVKVLNRAIIRGMGVTERDIAMVEQREVAEVARRARRYRGERPLMPLDGKTVIVVDDGIATGGTARAALEIVRAHGARRVVLAVPVGAAEVVKEFSAIADEVVAVLAPNDLTAIGYWYDDFSPTSDEEVSDLLALAAARNALRKVEKVDKVETVETQAVDRDVVIPVGFIELEGHLNVPPNKGIVVFVHGSGSSRHSPRNQYVASELNRAGLGTLLFDLLSIGEERARRKVFDIDMLTARLLAVTDWLRGEPIGALPLGYFGASTGAAAALAAAAGVDPAVSAVVSRGGRPDLADRDLADVRVPTLLIVGGHDGEVLRLNRQAASQLNCPHRIVVVPGASHLFEEPGTLEQASRLAVDWFVYYLAPNDAAPEETS